MAADLVSMAKPVTQVFDPRVDPSSTLGCCAARIKDAATLADRSLALPMTVLDAEMG